MIHRHTDASKILRSFGHVMTSSSYDIAAEVGGADEVTHTHLTAKGYDSWSCDGPTDGGQSPEGLLRRVVSHGVIKYTLQQNSHILSTPTAHL